MEASTVFIPHYEEARHQAPAAPALADPAHVRACRGQMLTMLRSLRDGSWHTGNMAEAFTDRFIAFAEQAHTIVDVGAERGFYAALARQVMQPESRLAIVEPEPVRAGLLVEFFRSDAAITVHAVAAWDADETLTLTRPAGCSPTSAPVSGETFTAPAVRLDDLLAGTRPDLIKIDVEGAEGRVLRGMDRVLREDRPVVLLEYHPWADFVLPDTSGVIEALLCSVEYRMFRCRPSGLQAVDAPGGRMVLLPC